MATRGSKGPNTAPKERAPLSPLRPNRPHPAQSLGAAPSADYRTFSRPVYRGPITHNTIAELAEGYRVLNAGQQDMCVAVKDIYTLMQNVGLHVSEEEVSDALRVVSQSERNNSDTFSFKDFLLLMTREVDDTMAEELRSAFYHCDKERTGYVTLKQFTEMFATLGERSSPEELEELLANAESGKEGDKIDYNRFVNELVIRLNSM